MIAEDVLVAEAAHRVGYGSPSQFSREYARMFGAPSTSRYRCDAFQRLILMRQWNSLLHFAL